MYFRKNNNYKNVIYFNLNCQYLNDIAYLLEVISYQYVVHVKLLFLEKCYVLKIYWNKAYNASIRLYIKTDELCETW